MALSLFLMLASETYCKRFCLSYICYSDSAPVQSVCCSDWRVSLPSLMPVPVYKLVRFYEPGSEAQYETTRATLTVFSR